MKTALKRISTILIAALAVLMLLTACLIEIPVGDPVPVPATPPVAKEPAQPGQPDEPQTLIVGYSPFSRQFSPFFSETAYDTDVWKLVSLNLFNYDIMLNPVLSGIEGQAREIGGVTYTYYGPADIIIDQKAGGTTDYNITLRDDLVFSDGMPVTIDDLIFTMYVYSDPDYDGEVLFNTLPITGMDSYRTGLAYELIRRYTVMADLINAAGPDNTGFEDWTKAQQDMFWNEILPPVAERFIRDIVDTCLYAYGGEETVNDEYYGSDVALAIEWWGYGELVMDDDGEPSGILKTYITGTEYDIEQGDFPGVDDFWDEMFIYYEGNLAKIGTSESATMDLMGEMTDAFMSVQGRLDSEYTGDVMNIEGIKKTGDYSVTVTTDYYEEETIEKLQIPVTPMHYYGDASLYNYGSNMFGFYKGDLTMVREKTTVPLGAGIYKFLSYKDGVVSMEANGLYFKGVPEYEYLNLVEIPGGSESAGFKEAVDFMAYQGWMHDLVLVDTG